MYIELDEQTDVLCSLRHCKTACQNVRKDVAEWKWVIISLHSALQGAMICHLSGTAQLGALHKKCAERWLEWHDRDRKGQIERRYFGKNDLGIAEYRITNEDDLPPADWMAPFPILLKRLCGEQGRIEAAGAIVTLTNDQKEDAQCLNELRRELVHFKPRGWFIEKTGLPRIAYNCFDIIKIIATDPWPFRNLDIPKRNELLNTLQTLMKKVSSVENPRPFALPNPHPGEILLEEFLKPMDISQNALARAIEVPPRRINEIVQGKRAITADTDLRLARYFGVSEGFFLGLQADHDLMARKRELGDRLESIPTAAA